MLMLQKELLERCSSAENMKQPLLIISHQRIDFHLLELSGSSEPSINCLRAGFATKQEADKWHIPWIP